MISRFNFYKFRFCENKTSINHKFSAHTLHFLEIYKFAYTYTVYIIIKKKFPQSYQFSVEIRAYDTIIYRKFEEKSTKKNVHHIIMNVTFCKKPQLPLNKILIFI